MKRFRAFTLIECLIALFILGISSLLLCQGYTQLMRLTNRSSTMSASIGQQMADAELGDGLNDGGKSVKLRDDTMKIKLVSEGVGDTKSETITVDGKSESVTVFASPYVDTRAYDSKNEYSTKMQVWVVRAYKYRHAGQAPDQFADNDSSKDGSEMRYVYFHT